MRKASLPIQRLLGGDQLLTLANDMHLADVSALYAAIGEGHVSAQSVVQKLVSQLGGAEGSMEDIAEATIPQEVSPSVTRRTGDVGVVVKGVSDVWIKLARCCTPVPGDDILGFVTRGGGVSVHRRTCTNAESLLDQRDRLLEVEWAPSADSTFVVSIQVEALDRHGLLSDVTRVLTDERVSILSANVSTNRDRVAVSRFTFEMAEAKHLGHLLRAIKNVDGVYDAYRVHSINWSASSLEQLGQLAGTRVGVGPTPGSLPPPDTLTTLTVLKVSFSFGAPPPTEPLEPSSPPAATACRIDSPLVTCPITV